MPFTRITNTHIWPFHFQIEIEYMVNDDNMEIGKFDNHSIDIILCLCDAV